ncbi:MAG: competence/damage-inducible protein A [Alphaproteobacteria bacterium]|nr:competence/damage-inducible protein A [Alphaproteobacteria bacterium]
MTVGQDPTAAVLIIGNEILSGRTQDVNLNAIARGLGAVGIPVREARVVPDTRSAIVEALNILRAQHTYVFTTGGIGPTHDDITVDAVAAAFGVPAIENPAARAVLVDHYGADRLTPARLRMARTPQGAELVANPVSAAPGIKIGNVFILAGVPDVMRAMLDGIIPTLRPGPAIYSKTVSAYIAESVIAEGLGAIAARFAQLDIGSYPWVRDGRFGTALVARGTDEQAVAKAAEEIMELVLAMGAEITSSAA